MQYKSVIAAALMVGAANATTGKLGDAAPVLDNPANVTYIARFDGAVSGFIRAEAQADGKGVDFEVKIKSVDGAYATPLAFHLHDAPVSNGDCATTLAHLDPYQRGQTEPCDADKPETCEVGDLSGKHGKITEVPYAAAFNDLYASTKSGIGAFFGNRSIVIHANDETKSRIACANFELEEEDCDEDEEEDNGEGEEDEEDCDEDEEVPGPSGTTSAPMVTSTMTVTAPCPVCPGETTVYVTTTVCPEGTIPTVPAVPTGTGTPSKPGPPGGGDKPGAPGGGDKPGAPGGGDKPGAPGGGDKPGAPGGGDKPGAPAESSKPGAPGGGVPEKPVESSKPGAPIGTGTYPKPPSGTGISPSKPVVTPAPSKSGSGNVPPKPSTSTIAEYTGAASIKGVSSALAIIGGAVALLAAF